MKIVLVKEMILKKGLPYEDACILLKKASESKAGKFIFFNITNGNNGWNLVGNARSLSHDFLANPEDFVIDVPLSEEKVSHPS